MSPSQSPPNFVQRWLRILATGDLSGETRPDSHHAVHWATVLACLLGVTWLVHVLESSPAVLGYRYGMYQLLSRLGPERYYFRDVVVVTVDDPTYWQGELASRVPTDRRYLAKLVRRVAESDPRLIALDFDLRSPDPEGKLRSATQVGEGDAAVRIELPVHRDHLAESVELFHAADDVAQRLPVVLPATIKRDGHGYRAISDADDGYPFRNSRVVHGYLQLADDRRVVPPSLELEGGEKVDSFSLAIVRQANERAVEASQYEQTMYASFVPREKIPAVSTSELFSEDDEVAAAAADKLRGKLVLIGADWHSRSLGEGPMIDSHPSPVGLLQGVMLHANYVESVLGRQFVSPSGMAAATAAEWGLTALVAFLMIARISPRAKLAWAVAIAAAYPLLSFFGMRLLGVYTDVLLLSLALGLHILADVPTRFVHLTRKVHELERRLAQRGKRSRP